MNTDAPFFWDRMGEQGDDSRPVWLADATRAIHDLLVTRGEHDCFDGCELTADMADEISGAVARSRPRE